MILKVRLIPGTQFLDITDRKRAEEDLRRLRSYLTNIINSMPSVLVGVDNEGRVEQAGRIGDGKRTRFVIRLPKAGKF